MKSVKGKVIIKVDIEQKNGYTFSDGTNLIMPRDVENLNKCYTWQTMGECIDAENIPKGALILFHHNATHDVNVVFDSDLLTKEEKLEGFKIISIKEHECFLWKQKGECDSWNTTKGFATAYRVFQPYVGRMVGIEPKLIKNVLYIRDGEFKDKVVHTLKAADYQITFRNEKGVDENFVRCRHFEDEYHEREEITAVDNGMTEKVRNGELLIGITVNDAKILNRERDIA